MRQVYLEQRTSVPFSLIHICGSYHKRFKVNGKLVYPVIFIAFSNNQVGYFENKIIFVYFENENELKSN